VHPAWQAGMRSSPRDLCALCRMKVAAAASRIPAAHVHERIYLTGFPKANDPVPSERQPPIAGVVRRGQTGAPESIIFSPTMQYLHRVIVRKYTHWGTAVHTRESPGAEARERSTLRHHEAIGYSRMSGG